MHAHSPPALCDPMDYSPQDSPPHGIFQEIILECIDPSPWELPHPGIEFMSPVPSALAGRFFALCHLGSYSILSVPPKSFYSGLPAEPLA